MMRLKDLPEWEQMGPVSRDELQNIYEFARNELEGKVSQNVLEGYVKIHVHSFMIGWKAAMRDENE